MLAIWRNLLVILDSQTRRGVIRIGALSLLVALLEMIGIGMFLPVLQVFLAPDRISDLPMVGPMLALKLAENPSATMLIATLSLFVFFVLKNTLLGVMTWYQKGFVYREQARYQVQLFTGYMRRPWIEGLEQNSSEIARNLMRSVSVVFTRVLLPTIELVMETLLACGALAALLLVEPAGTLVAGITTGLVLGLFFAFVRQRISIWGKAIEDYTQACYLWINQGVAGLKQAKALGREGFFIDKFEDAAIHASRYSHYSMAITQIPRLLGEATILLTLFLIVVMITWRGQQPAEALPVLGVFAAAAFRILPSLNRIVQSFALIRAGGAACAYVRNDLKLVHTQMADRVNGQPMLLNREIRLNGVSFRYPRGETPAVNEVSLTIRHGEVIALVGRSGSGKTTLADLLLGLIEPQQGQVLVDGQDIHAHLDDWRRSVALVPQHVVLFDDSLTRNVAFALKDEAIDERRVWDSLAGAQLTDVVKGLPDGLSTSLGEGGSRLSGGQRQRVGIARALYEDAAVIILDEATSALDNETESQITATLSGLRGHKTLVVIAHRLNTLRGCDRIVMMDHGKLVACGTFDELMRESETFRRMVQLGGNPDEMP
ncbi:MAG: ABC transporter ATP-binding protein [Alphaproteobacteria bacterium]|nr:ABC transporter ATP-binding protein [Alphaproteobacteria bacterium]